MVEVGMLAAPVPPFILLVYAMANLLATSKLLSDNKEYLRTRFGSARRLRKFVLWVLFSYVLMTALIVFRIYFRAFCIHFGVDLSEYANFFMWLDGIILVFVPVQVCIVGIIIRISMREED